VDAGPSGSAGPAWCPWDAKFPLEACQRLLGTTGAEARGREARAVLRRSLKQRIDEIADKYIRPDEGTYDFALMYIPAEKTCTTRPYCAREDPGDATSVPGSCAAAAV